MFRGVYIGLRLSSRSVLCSVGVSACGLTQVFEEIIDFPQLRRSNSSLHLHSENFTDGWLFHQAFIPEIFLRNFPRNFPRPEKFPEKFPKKCILTNGYISLSNGSFSNGQVPIFIGGESLGGALSILLGLSLHDTKVWQQWTLFSFFFPVCMFIRVVYFLFVHTISRSLTGLRYGYFMDWCLSPCFWCRIVFRKKKTKQWEVSFFHKK